MSYYRVLCDIYDLKEGEIVEDYKGFTYGCCTDDEIPVCRNGVGPFYGVHGEYLEYLGDKAQ